MFEDLILKPKVPPSAPLIKWEREKITEIRKYQHNHSKITAKYRQSRANFQFYGIGSKTSKFTAPWSVTPWKKNAPAAGWMFYLTHSQGECEDGPSWGEDTVNRETQCSWHILCLLQNHPRLEICKYLVVWCGAMTIATRSCPAPSQPCNYTWAVHYNCSYICYEKGSCAGNHLS